MKQTILENIVQKTLKALSEDQISNNSELAAELNRTYNVLRSLAVERLALQGLSTQADIVAFHHVGELLANYLGIHRTTLWRHLKKLKKLGLVDFRSQVTTCRYGNVSSGTVFCVSVQGRTGVKLKYAELKEQHRDLERDIKMGRTAYAVQQSLTSENRKIEYKDLVIWLKNTYLKQAFLTVAPCGEPSAGSILSMDTWTVEGLLDELNALPERPSQCFIVEIAKRFAKVFNDSHSIGFWVLVLSRLTTSVLAGSNHLNFFKNLIRRFISEYKEGVPKKPMGFFVNMIKQSGLWDEINIRT